MRNCCVGPSSGVPVTSQSEGNKPVAEGMGVRNASNMELFSFSLPDLGTSNRRILRAEISFLTGQDILEIFKSRLSLFCSSQQCS